MDMITVTINGLPDAPVVEIAPDTPVNDDDLTASITTEAVDPDGGTVTYIYSWTVDGSDAAISDSTVPASATASGQTWTVTATARDDYGTGASASDSVTINTPPTCAIVTPTDGSTVVPGAVAISATASDVDESDDALSVVFSEATLGELGTATPAAGTVSFSTEALEIGSYAVSMLVTDSAGETCSASVSFEVGGAPAVAITAPADGTVFNDGEAIAFAGTATDEETSDWLLGVVWTSDVDGVLNTVSPTPLSEVSFTSSDLSVGDHTITLSATDGDGQTSTTSIVLTVNGLPTAPTVTIAPADPSTTDDLVATGKHRRRW